MIIPVILSGGSGTRLWPLSREHSPKQFLPLAGESSLFQQTLKRAKMIGDCSPIVVCNEEHRFMAAEQLRQVDTPATILIEPVGRNTAPAIALAAFQAVKREAQSEDAPVLLILAADHGRSGWV